MDKTENFDDKRQAYVHLLLGRCLDPVLTKWWVDLATMQDKAATLLEERKQSTAETPVNPEFVDIVFGFHEFFKDVKDTLIKNLDNYTKGE